MTYLVVAIAAYLLGSIPFGVLVVRLARGVDVRDYGSGVTGVTNVLRTAGPIAAVAVLAGDASKGVLAVTIARLISDSPAVSAVAGTMVVVGHIWPLFAGFRGGRGILTGWGSAVTLATWAGVAGIATFALVLALSRYASLGSISAVVVVFAVLVGGALAGVYPLPYLAFAGVVGPLLLLRHRENLSRLLKGTERRLGEAAERRSPDNGV